MGTSCRHSLSKALAELRPFDAAQRATMEPTKTKYRKSQRKELRDICLARPTKSSSLGC